MRFFERLQGFTRLQGFARLQRLQDFRVSLLENMLTILFVFRVVFVDSFLLLCRCACLSCVVIRGSVRASHTIVWGSRAGMTGHMVRLPIGGAYSRDPRKYNYIFSYKFLVFAGISRKYIFRIIWQMGGSRCVQTSPTGCGNDLPICSRNHFIVNKNVLMLLFIDDHVRSPIWHFLLCFKQRPQAN